jgi:hypothetical protein
MATKTNLQWWAKNKLAFAIPIVILSLMAFTKDRGIFLKEETPLKENFQEYSQLNGWSFNSFHRSDYKISIDNRISQHGQKSALIESDSSTRREFSTLLQSFIKKEFKGKRIKMTGFIKSQGVNDTATMWLRVDDCDKIMSTDFDNMMERPIVGTKDWTKCEIIFDVAEKCVVFYGFIIIGTGKFWIDNVSFEIVDSSVGKTAINLNAPFPDVYLDQLKQYPKDADLPERPPVNLDFEE